MSSTDEEVPAPGAGDQLVVVQVHHDPIPEQEESHVPHGVLELSSGVLEQDEEVEDATTVNEPPKGLYKITCRHNILYIITRWRH